MGRDNIEIITIVIINLIIYSLWELTRSDGTNSHSTSEKQCLKIYDRKQRGSNSIGIGSMVDSIISINSHASSSLATSSFAQMSDFLFEI